MARRNATGSTGGRWGLGFRGMPAFVTGKQYKATSSVTSGQKSVTSGGTPPRTHSPPKPAKWRRRIRRFRRVPEGRTNARWHTGRRHDSGGGRRCHPGGEDRPIGPIFPAIIGLRRGPKSCPSHHDPDQNTMMSILVHHPKSPTRPLKSSGNNAWHGRPGHGPGAPNTGERPGATGRGGGFIPNNAVRPTGARRGPRGTG